jgi:hypothetical protein
MRITSYLLVGKKLRDIGARNDSSAIFSDTVPTPMATLREKLERLEIPMSEVKQFHLIAEKIEESVAYLKKFNYDQFPITLTGYCENKDFLDANTTEFLKFESVPIMLTEHINLVELSGNRNYVWFEPYHANDKDFGLAYDNNLEVAQDNKDLRAFLLEIDQIFAQEIKTAIYSK